MNIIVNGNLHQAEEGTTVAALLTSFGFTPQHVAVELNEELLPREQHPGCTLKDGDQLEVVTLVGGG